VVASSECVPSYDSVYLLDKSVKAINRDFAASANSQISDGTIAAVACIMNLTACLSSTCKTILSDLYRLSMGIKPERTCI